MGALAEIVGHETQVELLRSAVASRSPAEAYLFAGLPGVGKKTLALAFASALNCEGALDDACGECVSCRKAASFNHPDVRLFQPDGAVFKVDQVREIRRLLSFQPMEGRRKAYVLTDVETMRAEAANAFLKSLEEPPGATTIILTTSNINALLPTILSRCQILKLLPAPMETLTAALVERGMDEAAALALARQSGGRAGRAFQAMSAKRSAGADEQIEALRQADALDAFRLAEGWQNRPEQLEELMASLRRALQWRVGLKREECSLTLAAFARGETERSLQRKMRAVMEAQYRLKRNLNGALVMECLAFELLAPPGGQRKR